MKDVDEKIFNEIFEHVSQKYGIDLIFIGEELSTLKDSSKFALTFGYITALIITTVIYIEQTDAKVNDVVSNLFKNFSLPDF